MKTVELQFQGKQYIYLPKTWLKSLIYRATMCCSQKYPPLTLKISNIKSSQSHIRIQAGSVHHIVEFVRPCASSIARIRITALLEGERARYEIPKQV